MSFFSRSAIIAPKTFNRWLIVPAALAIHLSIGQVYGFSVFKKPMMEHFGVGEVAVGWIFSLAIGMLGISSALFGSWVEKVGPRASMAVSGTLWVIGFFVATLGISTGNLWLVYFGYGFIGGIGLGIGYISPVSTLMKWFPDRPGLATGLAIMGFGGGALIASPASNRLMEAFGGGTEIADRAAGLQPTFITLALVYAAVIAMGAYCIRLPHPDWTPSGAPRLNKPSKVAIAGANVSAANAIRTPQFWCLWVILFCNITAGIGILENAAPMIQDYYPALTAAAAAGFVGLLSLANMGGRFIWSSASDVIGRKNIYMVYLGVGFIFYFVLASAGHTSLALFVISALILLTFYGGGFATIPAYLRDLFGVYQVGAIHGRLLTAWSAAGVAGPLIINMVVERQAARGNEGPQLYQLSLYIMCALLAVGLIANFLVKPVERKWFEDPAKVQAKIDADRASVLNAQTDEQGKLRATSGAAHTAVAGVLAVVIVLLLVYGLWETAVKASGMFVG
ncbi:OFA family MFS transporter [Corynebacterium sp. Marseille-P4321]|uniref:OFA family MFS transporter n=1 Tax=Corynebacterium sp. Marseille-P4321 TaxID=2736603 RepID=UPI00158D6B64|nr:OFA family MFS transporter [Corynebacterium sp. Marseille-P4321]